MLFWILNVFCYEFIKIKKQKNSLKLIGNIVKNIKENFTKKWYKKLLKSVDIFRKTCYNVEKF